MQDDPDVLIALLHYVLLPLPVRNSVPARVSSDFQRFDK